MSSNPKVSFSVASTFYSFPADDPTQSDCPPSFTRLGAKCYFYGYFNLNWFRALEFCHSFGEGVSLASIETYKENVRIKNWLIHNGKSV